MLAAPGANGVGEPPPEPGMFSPTFFITMIIIIVAFYLLIQRPQKRQQEERARALSGLKRGDKVVSAGGIHGVVARANKQKNTTFVTVARNVEMEFNTPSLTVIRDEAQGGTPKVPPPEPEPEEPEAQEAAEAEETDRKPGRSKPKGKKAKA